MASSTCSFDNSGVKKGAWTQEEDKKLVDYVTRYGHWNWCLLPKFAGLARSGKSCRLRWLNYLRPNIKRGNYTKEEEETIIKLHQLLGNRWSTIASQMPGRTDNEIKNYWNTNLKKRFQQRSVKEAKISESKKDQHLTNRQTNLKKRFQQEGVVTEESHNTTRSKDYDHSPLELPTVDNMIGPSQLVNSCMSESSSTSAKYTTTVANNENMNLEDDEFAFLDVDTYHISHVISELDQCFSPVNLVTETQAKEHSPVSPIANNIKIGPFQNKNSTQLLANYCPFSHQYSSLSESSSTSTKLPTSANNEYVESEDEFAFLDTDTYPRSGNIGLEQDECFSLVKSSTLSNSKEDHSLVSSTTEDDIIGPFQSHHNTTKLADSDSSSFSQHHSSMSKSSSTNTANNENLDDLEDKLFSFLEAEDTYPMSENLLLEPYIPQVSYIPSQSISSDNIIVPFHGHHITTQFSDDSCPFSQQYSSTSESSSTSTKYSTINANNENMNNLEDAFAFLGSDTYPLFENFLLEPYMPLDNDISYVSSEPEPECFSSVNTNTEEAQASNSKDHSVVVELTPINNTIGPFQSHHAIQLADSCAFSNHSSLRESSFTDANFTTINENMVLEDEFASLDSDTYPMSDNMWPEPYYMP